jgi:hypothetical protein
MAPFFHSPPYPYLKCGQPFLIFSHQGPRLCSVQSNIPNLSLCLPFLHIFIQHLVNSPSFSSAIIVLIYAYIFATVAIIFHIFPKYIKGSTCSNSCPPHSYH